jgi:hypothetical protein
MNTLVPNKASRSSVLSRVLKEDRKTILCIERYLLRREFGNFRATSRNSRFYIAVSAYAGGYVSPPFGSIAELLEFWRSFSLWAQNIRHLARLKALASRYSFLIVQPWFTKVSHLYMFSLFFRAIPSMRSKLVSQPCTSTMTTYTFNSY